MRYDDTDFSDGKQLSDNTFSDNAFSGTRRLMRNPAN